jgi:hypothetical protein
MSADNSRSAFGQAVIFALGAPGVAMAATFLAFGAAVQEAGLVARLGAAGLLGDLRHAGAAVLVQAASRPAGRAAWPRGDGRGRGECALPADGGLADAGARRTRAGAPAAGGALHRRHALGGGDARAAGRRAARAARLVPRLRLTSWVVAGFASLSGYFVAGALGEEARAALLFVNPLYYALLLAADFDRPAPRRAVLWWASRRRPRTGAAGLWALLGAGLVGGTVAFLLGRRRG